MGREVGVFLMVRISHPPRSASAIAHTRPAKGLSRPEGTIPSDCFLILWSTDTLSNPSYQSLIHMAERLTLSCESYKVAMLGLTFCLTAPMIAPACLLFFVANFVVWRYHTLYVYERGWESNGSMWFTVVELVVWSLLVAQSFTSCVLFSKQAYLEGIVLYITVPYYLYKYIVSVKAEFGSGNRSGLARFPNPTHLRLRNLFHGFTSTPVIKRKYNTHGTSALFYLSAGDCSDRLR